MGLATVPEALADFKSGKFVIVVDDEERENEGDLVVGAELLLRSEDLEIVRKRRSECLEYRRRQRARSRRRTS